MVNKKAVVLHVAEALGGGVMTAIADYIRNSSEFAEHYLIGRSGNGFPTSNMDVQDIAELGSISNVARAAFRLQEYVARVRPDYVHLHSSWAGVVGRTIPVPKSKIVYTPHCFAFERTDISSALRRFYYQSEKLLVIRTGVVAGCSPREVRLARRLGRHVPAIYIPNVAPAVARPSSVEEKSFDRCVRVVGAGRLSAQKGIDWFANFAQSLKTRVPQAEITWLGSGSAREQELLAKQSVNVSGWLEKDAVIGAMSRAHFYVHSAAWEGAPLAVLEAASLGIPIVARDIPALRSLGIESLYARPDSAADAVVDRDGRISTKYTELVEASKSLASRHTDAQQASALSDLYQISRRATHSDRHRMNEFRPSKKGGS